MEEPMSQDLLEVRFHRQPGQPFPVNPHSVQLFCAVDLHSWAVLHCQDFRAGSFPEDARDFEPDFLAEVLAEPVGTGAFLLVVNFLQTA